jgi:lipopolysaccharide export LptBFGC system permease protein LptF
MSKAKNAKKTVQMPEILAHFIKFVQVNLFRKIDVYFYRELFPNYIFGTLFFTFLMMLNELFFLIKFYVEYNVPLQQVMLLLVNLVPFLLSYTIPIGILPSYLLTMGRLSTDSEIIAMKSCGISTIRIFRPGIAFGIVISILAILFADQVVVPSNLTYIKLRAKIIAQKPAVELKEKAFIELGGYKISFEKMSIENGVEVLYNIHMVDINGRKTIEAEKGRFFTDPENPEHYILKFMNGSISEVMKNGGSSNAYDEKFFVASFRYLSIHTYVTMPQEYYQKGPDTMTITELAKDIVDKSRANLDQIQTYIKDRDRLSKDIDKYRVLMGMMGKTNMSKEEIIAKISEMQAGVGSLKAQVDALNKNIDNYRKNLPNYLMMKYQEKYALPFAALVFALICLAIGIYMPRSGRNEGLGLSIIIFLVFYGTKVGTENLILKGVLPPVMEWFPVVLFFVIAMVLLIRKIRE